MTNKTYLLLAILIISVFFTGFMLGINVSSTEPIEPLDADTLEALKKVVEERDATIAFMEENPKEVIKIVREEVAADAEAIAEVKTPTTVVAFKLTPDEDEVERGELIFPTVVTCTEINLNEPIVLDACLPSEFSVEGVLQEVGDTFVLNADLYHEHRGELVWKAPLKGPLKGWTVPPPVRKFWFLGPTAGMTPEGTPTFGAFGGLTWTHWTIMAQGDNTGFNAGIAWRGGKR